jgi:hypothetical protein
VGRQERAALLRECLRLTGAVSVAASTYSATYHKGGYETGPGEELYGWNGIAWALRAMAELLESDEPTRPSAVSEDPLTGRKVCRVFPKGLDALLFPDFTGDVWLQEGHAPEQDEFYWRGGPETWPAPKVSLVLGAGNQAPVVACDILEKIIHENAVVVCKMNPVNEYLGPFLEEALRPLVQLGALEIVYGGPEVGKQLCNHPTVADIHITGSGRTYDAIKWQGQPKVGEPPFKKHVGAELGNKTPYIICPGEWTGEDIDRVARSLVGGKVHNSGHNCIALEVIVTSKDWPQRAQLLDRVRHHFRQAQNRVSYYPGSDQSFERFRARYPDCEEFCGSDGEGSAPWLFKAGLDPEDMDLSTESWCGVCVEVPLPGKDAGEFLPNAVNFTKTLFGTLACSVYIDGKAEKLHKGALEEAVSGLEYGAININTHPVMAFAVPALTWGGHPGSTDLDIGSGNCVTHNNLRLKNVEKCVVRAPFRAAFAEPWGHDHRNGEKLARTLGPFVRNPSVLRLLPASTLAMMS